MWSFDWQCLVTRPACTALSVVGMTIRIPSLLGLFSNPRGIRDLVGGTIMSPGQETWQVPSSPVGGGIRPAGDGLDFGGRGDGRPPMAAAPRRTTEDTMLEDPNARLIATAREAATHVAEHFPRWVGDDEAARVAGILTRLANRLEAAGSDRRATVAPPGTGDPVGGTITSPGQETWKVASRRRP
jgi:hypothetical protein